MHFAGIDTHADVRAVAARITARIADTHFISLTCERI
jgi:hypothetical protein